MEGVRRCELKHCYGFYEFTVDQIVNRVPESMA